MELINLEIRSLVGFFFWGNLALFSVSLVYLKWYSNNDRLIKTIIFAKLFQAFMWLLLFNRGIYPDWLSINVGNAIGFIGFYLEADIMLRLVPIKAKKIYKIQLFILILFIFLINFLAFFKFLTSIRIMVASLTFCAIFLIPTFKYLFIHTNNAIKKLIGSFMLLSILLFFARAVEAVLVNTLELYANNYIQTSAFVSLGLVMIVDGVGILMILFQETSALLKESHERYKTVADFAYNWEYWINSEHEVIYMSPSCENITGFTVEDFKSNPRLIEEIILPEYKTDTVIEHFKSHQLMIEPVSSEIQFPIRTREGEIRWIGHVCQNVFDSKGDNLGRRASNLDLTHIKNLEFNLKKEMALKEEAVTKLKELAVELDSENKQLTKINITDSLTGINNREYFNKRIEEEILVSDRYESTASLIFFDLDHFKQVNDTYGHDVGDLVLRNITETVSGYVRKSDIFARWGGEEFIILMPRTKLTGAVAAAEKIRQAISRIEHKSAGQVTASIGVAERIPNEYSRSWFKRVDDALYEAKKEGRNCINVYSIIQALNSSQKYINWNKDWLCGNGIIDDQHKKLLELGNELVILSLNEETSDGILKTGIDEFRKHLIEHFRDEEAELKKIDYEFCDHHREIHNELIEKSSRLMEIFKTGEEKPGKIFHFLIDELVSGHLLKEDIKYFAYMEKKNPPAT